MHKYLLSGVASLALLSASLSAAGAQSPAGGITNNGQPVYFYPGSAIVGGAAQAAFTFSGTVTNTTNGSINNSILSVVPPGTSTPVVIPINSVLSGSGITTGATVVSQIDPLTYKLVTPSGASAGNFTTAVTVTATPAFSYTLRDTLQNTAVTFTSGGCTAGSPAMIAGATPALFSFTNGSGTCTVANTLTFGLPAATTSWECTAVSTKNPTTDLYVETGAASTTVVVFTDYSTSGVSQNTKANDVITATCYPH